MSRIRRAWLDLRMWWLEVRIEACTDEAERDRLDRELCRMIGERWGRD